MSDTAVAEKKKPVDIDLSDLSLQGDQLDINQEADAFASPAPPPELGPDGKAIKYRVTLSHKEAESKNQYKASETKTGARYIKTALEAKIIDEGGPFDGYTLNDNFVSTMVMPQSGTCRMAGILKALKVPFSARISAPDLARLFQQTINGEPQVLVEVQWGAYSEEEDKTVLRGEKRWPKDKDGKRVHIARYDKTGEEVTARAEIDNYLPLPA